MPPARPVLILLAFVALPTFLIFFSLLNAHPSSGDTESAPPQTGAFRSFFSFHSPSTLFPPSAIISLTDDNSTFFLSRPADFGPRLASDGMSGQLWVGSGFGDDNIRKGGAATGAEGELGCSDIPGWENGDQERHGDVSFSKVGRRNAAPFNAEDRSISSRNAHKDIRAHADLLSSSHDTMESAILSGTDDHLHWPLPDTQISKPPLHGQPHWQAAVTKNQEPTHADIQSLQETAEITNKVVLLSRGGCGILEKVKWAQRRGAAALIVGDDTRGGALVTMYARGDTSNITIPSLFTSHTTAHLLSSLIPLEGDSDDEIHADADAVSNERLQGDEDRPTFTAPSKQPRPTSTTPIRRKKISNIVAEPRTGSFWQRLGFRKRDEALGLGEDSRRPPSSGRLNWVNENFNDEVILEKRTSGGHIDHDQSIKGPKTPVRSQHGSFDGFEIGIQDWRDPDFVATKSTSSKDTQATNTRAAVPTSPKVDRYGNTLTPDGKEGFSGGSITPGSGEYNHNPSDVDQSAPYSKEGQDRDNWLSNALWGADNNVGTENLNEEDFETSALSSLPRLKTALKHAQSGGVAHDGLWVTLTPTTMSTTPFFDTLLVLVVSPLITLTVVYALLLLRARIRRRRWRAPKSVVERLPVRTYQTMPTSSTTSSTRLATPLTSSPTSPLLQSRSQSIQSRSRAHSKVESEGGEMISMSLDKGTRIAAKPRDKIAEAFAGKKKYRGKQIECVVCLEEYVEGHSQVMSLPCGHEFHAECM